MKGYPTTFVGLFELDVEDQPTVSRVEIPIIQRDYAQGRAGARVAEIRGNFVDALVSAVTDGEPLSLDFVYGEVMNNGTFCPLDGQQRLTTLFLLHWYASFRTRRLAETHAWKAFTYATRPSAGLFCRRLTEFAPPANIEAPAAWLTDQPWFHHSWSLDPTVQSMLTMIETLDERLRDTDIEEVWARLVNEAAISFHVLPIEDMSGDDLYIKMNSRGKPLTEFENFKAKFEAVIKEGDAEVGDHFAHRIDGVWSDILWPFHGGDDIVDDEFMRYIRYVTEICEWREGRLASGSIGDRTRKVFGADNLRREEHTAFLFHAFDTWRDVDVSGAFGDWFTTSSAADEDGRRVVLYGQNANPNLFEACCHTFGDMRGKTRTFSFSQGLLLYAVLVHRLAETEDFLDRLRVVRNLFAASQFETRLENMPKLVHEVEALILTGDLDAAPTFRQVQIEDERRKRAFLAENPALRPALLRLEDQSLLRGTLTAFELEPTKFADRADTFARAFGETSHWGLLSAAMLTVGDYQRRIGTDAFRFGTRSSENEGVWREILTSANHDDIENTRSTLMALLDNLTGADVVEERLQSLVQEFLDHREAASIYDWRYHLVKYDCMREGGSGIYHGANGSMGYELAMLYKTNLNSNYRDGFTYAMWRASGIGQAVPDPKFTGWATTPRWMRLEKSGVAIRSIGPGIALTGPTNPDLSAAFAKVCADHGVKASDGDLLLALPQTKVNGELLDTVNRVQVGASLLIDLVAAGL